jgi:hypothetical protein
LSGLSSPIRNETFWSWPRKAFAKLRSFWRGKSVHGHQSASWNGSGRRSKGPQCIWGRTTTKSLTSAKGVGKTTAISCLYSLLDPTSPASDLRERVVVLYSTFNQAPSTPVQLLLDHLRNAHGVRVDAGKVSVLVLPRDDEAMAVKDDSGETPIDDDDGCQLKHDQILRTQASGDGALNGVPMLFFNAKEDDELPEDIRPGNVVRFARRVPA